MLTHTRPRVLALAVVALALQGCGTIINLSGDKSPYGGVGVDLAYAEDPPLPQDEVGWFWTVDVPFSAIADTFLLPVYGLRALFVALTPAIDRGIPPGETGPRGPDGRYPDKKVGDGDPVPPGREPPPRLRPTIDDAAK